MPLRHRFLEPIHNVKEVETLSLAVAAEAVTERIVLIWR